MTATQCVKAPNTVEQQRISGGRPAEVAHHRNRVAGTGPAETYRCATSQIAQCGHGDHPLRGAHQITAGDSRTQQHRLVPHTVGQVERQPCLRIAGGAEGYDECGGRSAHRLDVGRVLSDRLAPDVMRR